MTHPCAVGTKMEMSTMTETFPERVARIKEDQNITVMSARKVAAAEIRIEREIRDRRTRALAESMRIAAAS